MKIMIIGVARSKTTVLTEKIKLMYPAIECLYEYFTYEYKKNNTFLNICKDINVKNNYIVKLISHNLFNNYNNIIHLDLETYDKLYLIERPDFFNQCCSLQIANNTKIFHNRQDNRLYDSIGKKKYILLKNTILYQAKGVEAYLTIKKYLIENNIEFEINSYYDTFDNVPKIVIQKSNLDYKNLILNYRFQCDIENIFQKHFNYHSLHCNFFGFADDLKKIDMPVTLGLSSRT